MTNDFSQNFSANSNNNLYWHNKHKMQVTYEQRLMSSKGYQYRV